MRRGGTYSPGHHKRLTADPADNRILECAEAGKVDYIVSGDAHLLQLKQHGSVPIVKVAEFLKQLG